MLKAFTVNQEHQTYIDLLEIKDKAAAAIKGKRYKFSIQLKAYDCHLSAFMESLDDTIFNDWISDWGEGLTMSNFDDNTWTIIKGYFWIHLIDRLKKKIIKDNRLKELKEQEEEKKRRIKQLKDAYKQAEINRIREAELAKQKEAELAKKIKIENKNKAKEEKQKRIDEENQNFENNIIKKIKDNKSNIDKKMMTNYLKTFYYL